MSGFELPDLPDEVLGPEWDDHENRHRPFIDYYGQAPFTDLIQRQRFQQVLESDLLKSEKWKLTPE